MKIEILLTDDTTYTALEATGYEIRDGFLFILRDGHVKHAAGVSMNYIVRFTVSSKDG